MTKLTQSYIHGATDVPLIDDTIGAHFDKVVDHWPKNEALVVRHQGIRWTYRELQERVDQFAAGLIALGLEPGDRLGVWSPNNAEWVVTQFAAAKAGLILVNINPAYRLSEQEYAINKVGCKVLITAACFKSSDYLGMLRALAPELKHSSGKELHARRLPTLRALVCIDGPGGGESQSGDELLHSKVPSLARPEHKERLRQLAAGLRCDEPINIQFTSGTTGFPKGATLTHRNVLNNGFFVGESMRLTAADRVCIPV